MATVLAADNVAQLLHNSDTRLTALEALEALSAPVDRALALMAAPALCSLLASDMADVSHDQFDRIALVLVRLVVEAPDDPATIYGATFGEGRLGALWSSDSNVIARALRKPASELTAADVRSMVYVEAIDQFANIRGSTKPWAAAGLPGMKWLMLMMSEHPLASK